MFGNAKTAVSNIKIDTVIGPSSNIEGKINAAGTVRIDGKYTGDIITEQDVIVGENGTVNGNIISLNTSISGKVTGNIMCRELLEILSSGRLDGDIEVKKIIICDGAVFKGKCNMMTGESAKSENSSIELNS